MEKEKEYQAFEKAVLDFPYSDIEEMDELCEFIFEWTWKRNRVLREKAWMYDDLSD